ncbi:membrane-spanning 4-domains subfamily A member 4A-like [Emydura macquarii macquarii]|uniref:membrane-spanning 4-domains subfamily A member 4A-like n=1 Tax=Emydura macquarii macquarii TaxID=1129001 RepID=UPI00352A844C
MPELESQLHSFLGVQPRVFGAVLVAVGLLQVAFGTLFVIDNCAYTDAIGIHFFPGVLLFLAGIIAITADRAPSMALVKACLVIQIVAAAVVVTINFLYVRDLLSYLDFYCDYQDQVQNCRVRDQILVYCTGMRGISLFTATLGLCLTISLTVFGCKAICYQNSEDDVVIKQQLNKREREERQNGKTEDLY